MSITLYAGSITNDPNFDGSCNVGVVLNVITGELYSGQEVIFITDYYFWDRKCRTLYYVNLARQAAISFYSGLLLEINHNIICISLNGKVKALYKACRQETNVRTILINADVQTYDLGLAGIPVAVLPASDLQLTADKLVNTSIVNFPPDQARMFIYKSIANRNTVIENFISFIKRPPESGSVSELPVTFSLSAPKIEPYNSSIYPDITYSVSGGPFTPAFYIDVSPVSPFSFKTITLTVSNLSDSQINLSPALIYRYTNDPLYTYYIISLFERYWSADAPTQTVTFDPPKNVEFPREGKVIFSVVSLISSENSNLYTCTFDVDIHI